MGAVGPVTGGDRWEPDGIIVDMDGVLYLGEAALPGLAEFIAATSTWPRVLLTNNSVVSSAACAARLRRLGAEVPEREILTVSAAMAGYLAAAYPPGTPVYVIGERPLHDAVRDAGLVDGDGKDCAAVVLGLDRDLRYAQLAAALALLRAGCPLIVASLDTVLLTAGGALPATGAIAAALRACAGTEPVCVGKPDPRFFGVAIEQLGVPAARILTVGDSLTADIAGGHAAGTRTALMLSGVTATAPLSPDGPRPDYVFGSLPELTRFLRRNAA